MPLNYSRFDHIEDSDDEKSDPKVSAAEGKRKELAEQLQKRLATEADGGEDIYNPEKPSRQTDRFAYAEAECQKLAHELIKACISKTPSIKVGNGVVSVTGVEKVEGDATTFQVRGEPRFTFDLSFKASFTYQWMGANFDAGAQRAQGSITICDFTDATSLASDKSPPVIRKAWTEKGGLDAARQKEVERSLGGRPWPPEEGSLLFGMAKTMEVFVQELPKQAAAGMRKAKEQREEAAREEQEEFAAGGGVKVEEVSQDSEHAAPK